MKSILSKRTAFADLRQRFEYRLTGEGQYYTPPREQKIGFAVASTASDNPSSCKVFECFLQGCVHRSCEEYECNPVKCTDYACKTTCT